MPDDDIVRQPERPPDFPESPEASEGVARAAVESRNESVKMIRKLRAEDKSPDRLPRDATKGSGRPEIVDLKDGTVIVKGRAPGPATQDELERAARAKESRGSEHKESAQVSQEAPAQQKSEARGESLRDRSQVGALKEEIYLKDEHTRELEDLPFSWLDEDEESDKDGEEPEEGEEEEAEEPKEGEEEEETEEGDESEEEEEGEDLLDEEEIKRLLEEQEEEQENEEGEGPSEEERPGVHENEDGQISKVKYPDETSRKFEYENGQLSRVENPDGTVLEKAKNGSWHEFDQDGKLTGQTFAPDSVRLDDNGNFTVKNNDGTSIQHRSDGTKIENRANGLSVVTNTDGSKAALKDGLPYVVTQPDGTSRYFERDKAGNISKISDDTGLTLEKKGDTWYMYQDKDGKGIPEDSSKITDKFKGNVNVDSNGTVRIDGPDKKITIQTNGDWIDESLKNVGTDVQSPTDQAAAPGDKSLTKPAFDKLSEEDQSDYMRSGGFTRHDSPKDIEKARDALYKTVMESGRANDLELRQLGALNEVLNKSQKARGIEPPDIYSQLGIPRPSDAPKPFSKDAPIRGAVQDAPPPGPKPGAETKLPNDAPVYQFAAGDSKRDPDKGIESGRKIDPEKQKEAENLRKNMAERKEQLGTQLKEQGVTADRDKEPQKFSEQFGKLDPQQQKLYREQMTALDKQQAQFEKTVLEARADLRADPEILRKYQDFKQELKDATTDFQARLKTVLQGKEELEKKLGVKDLSSEEAQDKMSPEDKTKYQQLVQEGKDLKKERARIDKLDQTVKDFEIVDPKVKLADGIKELEEKFKDQPAKLAKIYESVNQILNKDTQYTTNLTEHQRLQIAGDLVNQIANPENIKQGTKGTCASASIEGIMAREHPERYAQVVAGLATEGKFRASPNSPETKITPEDIHNPDGNPGRGLASRIFQTALSDLGASYADPPGKYISLPKHQARAMFPIAPPPTAQNDTGERIIQGGKAKDWPGLDNDQQRKVIDALTRGLDDKPLNPPYRVDEVKVNTPAQLQAKLEELGKAGGYPVAVGFGTEPDGHFITVTKIDKGPPAIVHYVDSAEDGRAPKAVSMDLFYRHLANKKEPDKGKVEIDITSRRVATDPQKLAGATR